MDWNSTGIHSFHANVPLPFFMTHQGYMGAEQERKVLQDLEYLQSAYPNEVKRYQSKIAEILDKFDYEGSMIYDEYPDCYGLRRMAGTIITILQNEEKKYPEEERTPDAKWVWLEDMILVLLCHEIYKRRHGGRRGIIKF
ncbi:MAG: hypothetical protein J6A94_05675 [Lachnospiraceae bacterium]|nr:hypothetical protein [Lachnospiraceae bacterium]